MISYSTTLFVLLIWLRHHLCIAFSPRVRPIISHSFHIVTASSHVGYIDTITSFSLASIPRGENSIETLTKKDSFFNSTAIFDIRNEDYAHPREYTNVQIFSSIAKVLDQATMGFAFHYADLTPETPTTPLGITFLATNFCFIVGGFFTWTQQQDVWLASLTELAGIMSYWYHYCQLEFGKTKPREVRLALLLDYIVACTTILTGLVYLGQLVGFEQVSDAISNQVLIFGTLSIVCLTLSWAREFGYWYLFWHSMWHISSAYEGYLIGQNHYDVLRLVESSSSISA